MAAGQDEAPGLWVSIHHTLQIGGQFWCALNLVKDGTLRVLGQKATGVVGGKAPNVGVFQGEVRLLTEKAFGQGGLATLARSGQRDDRVLHGQLLQPRLDVAFNHWLMVTKILQYEDLNFKLQVM